ANPGSFLCAIARLTKPLQRFSKVAYRSINLSRSRQIRPRKVPHLVVNHPRARLVFNITECRREFSSENVPRGKPGGAWTSGSHPCEACVDFGEVCFDCFACKIAADGCYFNLRVKRPE